MYSRKLQNAITMLQEHVDTGSVSNSTMGYFRAVLSSSVSGLEALNRAEASSLSCRIEVVRKELLRGATKPLRLEILKEQLNRLEGIAQGLADFEDTVAVLPQTLFEEGEDYDLAG